MASKTKTASAKSATAEPAQETEVDPGPMETGDGASAVVAAENVSEPANTAEPAKKKEKTGGTWETDKNAELPKRIFRSDKFKNGVAVRTSLVTLNRQAVMIKGTAINPLTIVMDPNAASQYVLKSGAVDYADQLAALRKCEALGKVKEVDPKFEAVPYISENEKQIRMAETELAQLKSKRK